MTGTTQIYPDDGLRVIKFLEKTTGVKLPDYGLVAGQAVCSALMYLKGQDKNVNINDLDIFIPVYTDKSTFYSFNPHDKLPRERRLYSKLDRVDLNSEHRQEWRNEHYRLLGAKKYSLASKDEYEEIEKEAYRLFPSRKQNLLSFHESSHQLGYKILGVFRRGLKNIIFTQRPKFSGRDIFSFDVEAFKILYGFDLNCTQVGVDLKTGKIFYTSEFSAFLHSKQLLILNAFRPWHTIIRYFKKREEQGYFGNDELAIAIISTFHDLRTPDLMEDLRDLEPEDAFDSYAFYGTKSESPSNIPRFGSGYIEKYKSISGIISSYYELSLDRVEINRNDNADAKKTENLPSRTSLGGLKPRFSGVGRVLGGSHRKSLEKTLGVKIRNYPAYARSNVVPIVEDYFGLYGKKHSNKKSRLINGVGKINTRKNPFESGPFLKALSGRPSDLSGNVYQDGLLKVSKFLSAHPELKDRFDKLPLSDQITLTKRIKWLEKNHIHLAFHVINSNILISNDEITGLDPNALVEKLERSYQSWKDKEMAKPSLANVIFKDQKLLNGSVFATELVHNHQLFEEGNIQRHCVGGYGRRVRQGRTRIVSFRKNFNERVTAELRYISQNKGWAIVQFKTKSNRRAPMIFIEAAREWIDNLRSDGIDVSYR